MKIDSDRWLQRHLGGTVRVVRPAEHDKAAEIRDFLSGALKHVVEPTFFHAKVPVERVDHVAALTSVGFAVVDVNVTFSREPGPPRGGSSIGASGVDVRPVADDEGERVVELASSCFTRSRFHLDPFIPEEQANRVNGAWVADYSEGRRGELLDGAFVGGRLVGFNAILRSQVAGQEALIIDLIGVDPKFQGRGIGRVLVERFLHWSADRCTVVRVGTQAVNTPAVRLYEHFGFKLTEAKYVLHAHAKNGVVRGWD